jgi:Ribbon-helix-helix protein, copG family
VERITATVSDEQANALRALAAERGTSIAAVIRAAADVLAEDGRGASAIRGRVRPSALGGARPGAGRPRRTWLTAAEAASTVRRELRRGDEDFAFRLVARLVADLRVLDRPSDVERCLKVPSSTGDRRWDTLLAVAVGRACRERGIEAPAWTSAPPLPSWWFPLLADPVLTARTMQRTPVDFAARGIWLEAKALETA